MRPVPIDNWEESLQHVVADMAGRPLDIHAVLANHPRLLDAWWKLRNYLVKGGDLEQRQCELVVLRIAVRMNSWYEWAAHVVRGLDSGLSLEEIVNVSRYNARWPESDAALLDAVDDIVRKNTITPATLERLSAHFSDRQILDIMHLHGMYATIACVVSTWELELDKHVEQRLPETITRQAFAESAR
jgi:alkylhydroperoxidase family enzyme